MAPKGKPRTQAEGGERLVRTTLELPEALWRATKMRAIDEGDLRAVVMHALVEYLAKPAKPKARKGA